MTHSQANDLKHGCSSVPELSDDSICSLLQAGLDRPCLKEFLSSISGAASLIDALPAELTVRFPLTGPRPNPITTSFLLGHWTEIVGRLTIAQLCADRTLRDLLLVCILGLQARNTIACTLSARAAIENSAAYDNLSRYFGSRKERIETCILPFINNDANARPTASLFDESLVKELLRFQHGTRLWPISDCPNNVEQWKQWRKHSRYEPAKEGSNDDMEQSIAGQVIDALGVNQRNVLSCIETVSKRSRNMSALAIYDMLSEFCHPNADNRGLGIAQRKQDERNALVRFVGTLSWTPGALRGAWLAMIGIVEAIDIHGAAHNTIFDSANDLRIAVFRRQIIAGE